MKKILLTLTLGAVGGSMGNALEIPLGWLLGAMLANMAASIYGLGLGLPQRFRTAALAVLGVLLGASFTVEVFARIQEWSASMLGLLLSLLTLTPLAVAYGRRVTGFDRATALYAGAPGGFGEMVMLSAAAGANPRQTALAHTARLGTILIFVPLVVTQIVGVDLPATSERTSALSTPLSALDAVILLACAIAGPPLARLARIPAAMMTGALIASAAVHMTGLTSARPPAELISAVQVVIGANVGSMFSGAHRDEIVRTLVYSTGLTALIIAIALGYAVGVAAVSDVSAVALLLAFVPGGLAEMSIIALLIGVDPIFVATHHLVRVLLVYAVIPVLAERWRAE